MLSILAILAGGVISAQTRPAAVRLIVQGDDMSAAHGINTATICACKDGTLRSTNVIVPGPWFLAAVQLLNDNPGLDVDVHLCLTSEWERVKWRPLTHAPSLADAEEWPNQSQRGSGKYSN